MDHLDAIAIECMDISIVDILYGGPRSDDPEFKRTLYSHPALFMVQLSLAKTMINDGFEPDILCGASIGEHVASALAGVAKTEAIFKEVINQAKLFESTCDDGYMISVFRDSSHYYENTKINENCELAGIYCDEHFVIAGDNKNLENITSILGSEKIDYFILPVSYGFHSSAITKLKSQYLRALQSNHYSSPKIPIFSCVNGLVFSDHSASYSWDVLRKPVIFQKTIKNIHSLHENAIYVDLGPSATLAGFAKRNLPDEKRDDVVSLMSQFNKRDLTCENIADLMSNRRGKCAALKQKALISKESQGNKMGVNEQVIKMAAKTSFLFPGQGSQVKGMGKDLFGKFPEQVTMANNILGWDIEEVCLRNPDSNLSNTQFTQPALFFVSALTYLEASQNLGQPDFLAGHSLGEFNALHAAGVFDLETGLRLVKKRGELMGQAKEGGMAAILGLNKGKILEILKEHKLDNIDIANENSSGQTVISGNKISILELKPIIEGQGGVFFPLNVSAAFHSRYMKPASQSFSSYLQGFDFDSPKIPVIANVDAKPYRHDLIKDHLANQIVSPVKWNDTVRYLIAQGVDNYHELGPGNVLTKLTTQIQNESKDTPLSIQTNIDIIDKQKGRANEALNAGRKISSPDARPTNAKAVHDLSGSISSESLGASSFKDDYGVRYCYVAGSMYRGIASKELVVKMGKAGMIGFFGAGGMSVSDVSDSIDFIKNNLNSGQAYGINLLHHIDDPKPEDDLVDLLILKGVRCIEASAYLPKLSSPLVRYRIKGLSKDASGRIIVKHKIIAKLSRPEVASAFLGSPPDHIIKSLLDENKITRQEALLARQVPMADDICVEADSGGHTDRGMVSVLLPAIQALRDRVRDRSDCVTKVRIGVAGGIGTPEAAASAFIMGADFILTGSINQCSVEANTSDLVKDLLQQMNVQDTGYAPSAEMFEIGAKVQVLKKGILFAARANKLLDLYQRLDSLNEMDDKQRRQLEEKFFGKSIEDIYEDLRLRYGRDNPGIYKKADENPKIKMALVFRWYLSNTSKLALKGNKKDKVNFQIHTGPCLGAFNQWVEGTELESWRARNVDKIAHKLMNSTAELLNSRYSMLKAG